MLTLSKVSPKMTSEDENIDTKKMEGQGQEEEEDEFSRFLLQIKILEGTEIDRVIERCFLVLNSNAEMSDSSLLLFSSYSPPILLLFSSFSPPFLLLFSSFSFSNRRPLLSAFLPLDRFLEMRALSGHHFGTILVLVFSLVLVLPVLILVFSRLFSLVDSGRCQQEASPALGRDREVRKRKRPCDRRGAAAGMH
eukprot:765882-Hanusia_phi.AAC.1